MNGKFLAFWTNGQLFAVPIADVVQMIGVQKITGIPNFSHFVKGVIHMRGSVVPIIDVRLRFRKSEIPYNDHTCKTFPPGPRAGRRFFCPAAGAEIGVAAQTVCIRKSIDHGETARTVAAWGALCNISLEIQK